MQAGATEGRFVQSTQRGPVFGKGGVAQPGDRPPISRTSNRFQYTAGHAAGGAATAFRNPDDQLIFHVAAHQVVLAQLTACGRDHATWVRLCFTCVPPDDLADAVTRLAGVLATKGLP